jgi:hypothetical protein
MRSGVTGRARSGWALNSADVCRECTDGTYSVSGQSCVACPSGALCTHAPSVPGAANIGVPEPVSVAGRWLSKYSTTLAAGTCSQFAYDSGQCPAGSYVSNRGSSSQSCVSDNVKYTPGA